MLTKKQIQDLPPGKRYVIKGTKEFDPSKGKYVERTNRASYTIQKKSK